MKQHLTERFVKAMVPDAGRDLLVYDEVTGFGLYILRSGKRGFFLRYRIAGRDRRFTIGSWPTWSVTAAREEAKRLKREIDAGHDPLGKRIESRNAPTISDLIDRYLREHAVNLSPRSQSDQTSILHKMVEPEWGNRKVAEITPEDVDRLLAKVAKGRPRPRKHPPKVNLRRPPMKAFFRPTPIRANRVSNSADRSREQLFQRLYSKFNPKVAGHLWYSFDVAGLHFVSLHSLEALHTDPRWGNVFFSGISEEQFAWLETDLQAIAGKADGIIVFLHQPLWYNWTNWQRVHALLSQHKVKAVIAGHTHYNQIELPIDGIQYLIVGATGGDTKAGSENAGNLQHVTVLYVAGDKLTFSMFPISGFSNRTWTDRWLMDRVQALDSLATNISGLGPLYLENHKLVRTCGTKDAALIELTYIGNAVELPVRAIVTLKPPASIEVLPKGFGSGLCEATISPTECLLKPSAGVGLSNTSVVLTNPGSFWLGEVTAKDPDSVGKQVITGSRDFFGTAYGQSGDRFEGFALGGGNAVFDDTLLLIEPEAAKAYEAHLKTLAVPATASGGTVPEAGTGNGGSHDSVTRGTDEQKTIGPSPTRPRSFHGAASIVPATAKMRLVQIADEIIAVLGSDPNATVKVVLEISAEFPGGAIESVKRAVSENARSLGLKSAEWE